MTVSSFADHYQQHIAPLLEPLEVQRKKALRNAVIAGVVAFPLALVVLFAGLGMGVEWLGYMGGMLFFGGGVAVIATVVGKYKSSFKQQIIPKVIHFVSSDLAYNPEGHIGIDEYYASKIYTTGVDRYNGEDLVEGRVGATALRFSEVHSEYKTTTTDSKGNRQTHWHTIFKGLLFIADFNKHFNGLTVVLPDTAERLFGGFGQMLQSWSTDGRGELVKLEDPEFEKQFVVYGTDQVEARYILSTSLMRRILEFKERCKQNVSLSFANSNIYVAIPSTNLFEPPLMKTVLDPAVADGYLSDVRFVLDIVEELNLNLRIWSKQADIATTPVEPPPA